MTVFKQHSHWIMVVAAGVCLAGVALVSAEKESKLRVPAAQTARELSSAFRDIAQQTLPSIVSIETRGKAVKIGRNPLDDERLPFHEFFRDDPRFKEFFRQRGDEEYHTPLGMGSGFIIDSSGLIMTNTHVVKDAERITVRLYDGREYTAKDVRTDPRSDVAVIRIDAEEKLHALPLGNSDETQIGDWVLAMGSPFGLDMSVTAGIISAKGRGPGINEREDFLQTDAAINPGNSGGPLVNLNGEVIGINSAISTRSGGYDGVGFAIPINMAHWVSQQLTEKGKVERAYLGVGIQKIDNDLAKQLSVNVGEGVVVSQVMPGTPAAEAKLQPGDIILSLDGKQVTSPRNLQGIVERLNVGKTYNLQIQRNGKRQQLKIKFQSMPEQFSLNSMQETMESEQDNPSEKVDSIGIQVEELTPEVAEQLGYDKDAKGVVISSVESNSVGHLAGLRTGQIVEKVGPKKVQTLKDFNEAMKDVDLTKGVLMLVRSTSGTRFVVVRSDS